MKKKDYNYAIIDSPPISVIQQKNTMVEEMASLDKNEAWDLVKLPTGRNPIRSKWVFKNKLNEEGKVEKYKARLVAKGYS